MIKKKTKTETKKKVEKKEKKKKVKKPSVVKAVAASSEAGKSQQIRKDKKKKVKKAKVEKKTSITPVAKDKEKEKKEKIIEPERYYQAEGRRKTSVARVRIWTKGEKQFLINGKPLEKYFFTLKLQKTALASLEKMKCQDKFKVSVIVRGGGISSQAEAIRHGTAKILVIFNPDFRKRLKKAGFLRRDSRMRERKKFGLRRARRAKQWSKR